MFNFSLAQQKSLLSPDSECCADAQGWNSPAQGVLEQAYVLLWQKTHKPVQPLLNPLSNTWETLRSPSGCH